MIKSSLNITLPVLGILLLFIGKISEGSYYEFKSANPAAIISGQIRRHLRDSKTSEGREIFFKKLSDQSYGLLD